MANEKPFYNKIRNIDNENNSKDRQIHNINKTVDDDFVDFSAAFNDEEDERGFEEFEEEVQEPHSVSSLIKGFSFRKKNKDKKETDNEKAEKKPAKEKNKKSKHKKEKAEKVEEQSEQEIEDVLIENEPPVVEEVSVIDEIPAVEEIPVVEEAPVAEEIPVAEEVSAEEVPVVEEATIIEEIQEEPKEEIVVEEESPVVIEETEVEEESSEEEIEELAPFEYNEDDDYDDEEDDEENEDDGMPALVIDRVKQKREKEKSEPKSEQTEKDAIGQLTFKDHLTFILIILALLLTIVFICIKFIPFGNNNSQNTNTVTNATEKVSAIQLQRESAEGHYIQSDIENVFYVYSEDCILSYYQCDDSKMNALETTGTVNATVQVGTEKLPVKIDYIDVDGQLFGTGIFRASTSEGSFYHNIVIFKLSNLPKGYEQDSKALLLATTNEDAASQKCSVWSDSYIIDLETGKTERFLKTDDSVYSTGYSILTDEGCASTNGRIPFFSTREYDVTTNKKDIYIKDGKKETSFATDVAGSFLYTDGDAVSYLKVAEKSFDAVRKENDKETVLFSLNGDTSYLYYNEYLLDKYNGTLYNVKTGKEIAIKDYGMSNAEMIAVSDNGRYLVVLGTVNNALDYQVHIFDLKSNKNAKFVDENFSEHKNLAFADDTKIVYSIVEPTKGYEYVMLDVSKAF